VRSKGRAEKLGTASLVLLAVAVVGAAVADSIGKSVSDGGSNANQPTLSAPAVTDALLPKRSALATRLREDDVSGVFYFVDQGCRLHALRLPSLVPVPAPRNAGCLALVSPASAPPGWSLWPRDTALAARCRRGRVIVSATSGPSLPMIGGCAPAWRPDGSMTYIRQGAIVQFPRTGRAQVLRSRNQLAGALQHVPALGGTSSWLTSRVAWLGPNRFAIVASNGKSTALAVFSGRHIVALRNEGRSVVTELRASPHGTYLVLRTPGGLRLYDARRRGLPRVRRFGAIKAIAWSSDGRWVGLARPGRVVLQGSRKQVVLPLDARDLAWTRG
jgi:hypothetical protein